MWGNFTVHRDLPPCLNTKQWNNPIQECELTNAVRHLLTECMCDRQWPMSTWRTWHQLCVVSSVGICKKQNKHGSREEFTGSSVNYFISCLAFYASQILYISCLAFYASQILYFFNVTKLLRNFFYTVVIYAN